MKESNAMSRYAKSMSDAMADVRAKEKEMLEVSPPGFKGTVKAMKKHDEIDNPYALAWHMKNKGDEAHYKDKDGRPEKKEKFKEEVELNDVLIEGLSMKDPKLNKLFDKLKKGDEVTIEYTSAMSRGKDTFKVTAKNVVGKMKVEKITLKSDKNPRGVKHFLYKRNGGVTMAQGDMATSIESIKEDVLNEAKKGLRYKGAPAELRARQLVDTSKETLIVKRNRVIVIDKDDEESYLKKGWQLAETFEAVDIDALHAEALQENESLQEAEWKVQLKGLPVFYVPAKSAGEVRAMLRKQIKKPDDIISVEKASKAEKKKDFRGRVQEK